MKTGGLTPSEFRSLPLKERLAIIRQRRFDKKRQSPAKKVLPPGQTGS